MYISLIKNIRSSLTHLHGFQLLLLLPQFIELTFFVSTKSINLLILKQSSDRLVIDAKGFLKMPNLHMLIKEKSPLLPRNFALGDFLQNASSVRNKGKSAIPPLFNGLQCCLLHLIKQKFLLKTFLRTLILLTEVSLQLFSLLELIRNCIIFL